MGQGSSVSSSPTCRPSTPQHTAGSMGQWVKVMGQGSARRPPADLAGPQHTTGSVGQWVKGQGSRVSSSPTCRSSTPQHTAGSVSQWVKGQGSARRPPADLQRSIANDTQMIISRLGRYKKLRSHQNDACCTPTCATSRRHRRNTLVCKVPTFKSIITKKM